jgi:hypothetical protein
MLEGDCTEIGGLASPACAVLEEDSAVTCSMPGGALIKDFAHEGVNQAMKLERALARSIPQSAS